jgi:diguanylate cyclase (GGDEF)-like protein/PAS domain S-box-containing protein
MQTRVRRTLLALAALALAVPVVDLILRMTAAAGSIQAETPSATPFIGMLLAASEFALAAVFAVFSLFVPGTRWARLWAVYHFLSGMSAAYHGSADFWRVWRPAFALLDAAQVACVAGGVADYVGRRMGAARMAALAAASWALILGARAAGLNDGGIAYLALMLVANLFGGVTISLRRGGYASKVVAAALLFYAVIDVSGVIGELAAGPGSLSILPIILNTSVGITILMASLFEHQRRLEAAGIESERARVELMQLAASLEQRTVDYAEARDRAQALADSVTESHERLRLLFEFAPASLAMFDRQMRYLAVSRRWLMDFIPGGQDVLGRSHFEIFPEIPAEWRTIYARAMTGEALHRAEDRFERRDGRVQWLMWDVRPWRTAAGDVGGIVIFTEDVTARKHAENELRIAATAFESQEGIAVADPRGTILRVNRAFSELTGYAADEVIGQPADFLDAGEESPAFYQELRRALRDTGYWQGEIRNRRRNGSAYVAWMTISAVTGRDGVPTHYVGAFADVTRNKEAEAQIHNLAYFDPLTQLPNRRMLLDRMGQIMANERRSGKVNAVLFMDLDNFKVLNDTRGHDAGDRLLVEAAQRVQAHVRPRDMVARLGGDEFVVVLEDLGAESHGAALAAGAVGEKLRMALAQPYDLGDRQFHCPASVGIALFRGDSDSIETVLKHADLAMYQAKNAGRNTLRFFDPAMQTALDQRSAMESDLRVAIDRGQLHLYYQPQIDAAGRIVGAEALIRWQHPEHGLVPPGDFIPLAEDTGLIVPIGQWVFATACEQVKAWSASAATRDLRLAVNVSARQFRQGEFVALVRHQVAQAGADPSRLKMEITESVVLDDVGDTFGKMNELKALGISFALDDFGTGNSSLSYLSKLPLNELKIDKSFVLNLPDNRNDGIIAQTIITLATSLGLEVVAEGVETDAQRAFLQHHGCHFYQGYLYARPMPLQAFEQFVAQWGRSAPERRARSRHG